MKDKNGGRNAGSGTKKGKILEFESKADSEKRVGLERDAAGVADEEQAWENGDDEKESAWVNILTFLGLAVLAAIICAMLWYFTHQDKTEGGNQDKTADMSAEVESGDGDQDSGNDVLLGQDPASGQNPEAGDTSGAGQNPGAGGASEGGQNLGVGDASEGGQNSGGGGASEGGQNSGVGDASEGGQNPGVGGASEGGQNPGAGGASEAGQDTGTEGISPSGQGSGAASDGQGSGLGDSQTGQEMPGGASQEPSGAVTMQFAERKESVTPKEEVNLRSVPSTADDDTIVVQCRNGEVLTRIGINQDTGWSQLAYGDRILYAVSQYLTTDLDHEPPAQTSNPNRVSTSGGRVIVFSDCDDWISPKEYVNLRTEPSTDGENETISCRLEYGEKAHRTGYSEDSGWSRVEYDGKVLYVVTSLIYEVEAE